jgi:hypothetical protein
MNRRGFIGSILAACAAPAIVRAESLMILPSRKLLVPELWMHGINGVSGALASNGHWYIIETSLEAVAESAVEFRAYINKELVKSEVLPWQKLEKPIYTRHFEQRLDGQRPLIGRIQAFSEPIR